MLVVINIDLINSALVSQYKNMEFDFFMELCVCVLLLLLRYRYCFVKLLLVLVSVDFQTFATNDFKKL